MRQATMIAIALAGLAACRTTNTSDVKVIDGRESLPNEFPEVVMVGPCTGTFVSATTLITAKHCFVNERSGAVDMISLKGHIPKIMMPRHAEMLTSNTDVAVLVFPQPVATTWATVAEAPVLVDDPVEFVGFGCNDPVGYGAGIKRIGQTKVVEISPTAEICLPKTGPRSCPGDSGGPNFVDGKLAGVTSWSGIKTCKVNLTATNMRQFLRQTTAFGAEISGIEPTSERDYAGIQFFDDRKFTSLFADVAASRVAAMPLIKEKVAALAAGGEGRILSWAIFAGPGVDGGAVSDIRVRLGNSTGGCWSSAPLKCVLYPWVLTYIVNSGVKIAWEKPFLDSREEVLKFMLERGDHASVWEEIETDSVDPLDVYLFNERGRVRTHALFADGSHIAY